MLIFQIKRIISSEKWFSYVVTFFFLFLKMPKIWVDQTTLNGEEKEDGLKAITLASHDHKDLVQIWLIKNPDLSGKSRISTANLVPRAFP